MISTAGATRAGMGYGSGGLSEIGQLYLRYGPKLLQMLGGKRDTESLGPGSFPGHNPDGSATEDGADPWQYANFSLPQNQTPGINPGARTPNAAGGPAGPPQAGGIGARALGALKGMAPQLIGAGTQLIGSRMASNQMNRGNEINAQNSERNYQMAQEEKRRRDALIKMIMPQLAQGMQVRDPERVRQMVGG